MSSANIIVGLSDDCRNKNKSDNSVKGQSHVDIFGAVVPTITPQKGKAASSIMDILQQETETQVAAEPQKQEEPKTVPVEQTPKRIRMPPGGVSNGFW